MSRSTYSLEDAIRDGRVVPVRQQLPRVDALGGGGPREGGDFAAPPAPAEVSGPDGCRATARGYVRHAAGRPASVEGMLARLAEQGFSAGERRAALTTLRTALKDAVRLRLIPSNPAHGVTGPK